MEFGGTYYFWGLLNGSGEKRQQKRKRDSKYQSRGNESSQISPGCFAKNTIPETW